MKISWILLHIFLQYSYMKPEMKIISHFDDLDGSKEIKENANKVEKDMDLRNRQIQPPVKSGQTIQGDRWGQVIPHLLRWQAK